LRTYTCRMVRHTSWALVVAVLCLSCRGEQFVEGRLMFRELLTLRDQIAKEFHEQVVDVSVGKEGRMTVKFVGSPLSARSGEEKQQRADAVAAFVASHYKQPVSSVSIQFVSADGGANVGGTYIGRPAPKK
jgi:hypothetical protein